MIKTSLVSSYCHVNPNPILLGQKFNLHAHAIFTKQSWVRVLQSGFLSYKWRNHQRLGDMHGKLKHRTSIITTGAEIQLIFHTFLLLKLIHEVSVGMCRSLLVGHANLQNLFDELLLSCKFKPFVVGTKSGDLRARSVLTK